MMHAIEKIRFASKMSDEVRSAIEPHLARWAFLIPGWCHELTVKWDDNDTSAALCIEVYYEYRNADLVVLPNFLSHAEYRETQVVHELMHLAVAPLTKAAESTRDALVEQVPDVEEWAAESLRQGEEATVCDLTAFVLARLA